MRTGWPKGCAFVVRSQTKGTMKWALLPPSKYHEGVHSVSFAGLSTPERVAALRRALMLMVVALVLFEESVQVADLGDVRSEDESSSKENMNIHPVQLEVNLTRSQTQTPRRESSIQGRYGRSIPSGSGPLDCASQLRHRRRPPRWFASVCPRFWTVPSQWLRCLGLSQ